MASPVITFLISNNSKVSATTLTATAGSKAWSAGDYLVAHLAMDPSAGTISFGAVTNFGAWSTNVEFTNGSGTSGVRSAVAYCKCTTGFTSTVPVVATFPTAAAQVLSLFSVTGADGTTPVRGSSGTSGLGGSISATAGNNFDGTVLQMPGIEGPSGTVINWGSTSGWTNGANSATSVGTSGSGSASNISAGYCTYTAAGVAPGGGGIFSGTSTGNLASVVLLFASFSSLPTLTNNFDGITPSGTAVSVANSGGASGNAFDSIDLGSGAAIVSDSAHAHSGSLSGHFTTGATAAKCDLLWSTSAGTNAQVWFRLYLYFTANPAALTHVYCCETTGGATQCISVRVTTTGKIRVEDSTFTQILITAASITLNQWVRVEGFVIGSATVGQAEVKLFNVTDSVTPTETQTSAATMNTGGPVAFNNFGNLATVANASYWLDDLGLTNVGYLGPVAVPTSILPQQAKKRMPAIFTRISRPTRRGSYSR